MARSIQLHVERRLIYTDFYLIGYITGVLEDARVYSEHAGKKELDVSDVRLAVQTRVDHSFTTPPPRDVGTILHGYTCVAPPRDVGTLLHAWIYMCSTTQRRGYTTACMDIHV